MNTFKLIGKRVFNGTIIGVGEGSVDTIEQYFGGYALVKFEDGTKKRYTIEEVKAQLT